MSTAPRHDTALSCAGPSTSSATAASRTMLRRCDRATYELGDRRLLRHPARASSRTPACIELIWSYWHEEGMLVQTLNAISARFQNMRGPVGQRSAGQSRDRSAAAAEQPAVGLHPGRAAPADASSGAPTSTTTTTGCRFTARPCPTTAHGRQPLEVPRGVPQPAAPVLVFYKQDDDTTVIADGFPLLNALQGSAPAALAGRAQPVRRPAVDGAHRDADAAVAPGAAGVPRVPADARHGGLPGAVDGPRRRDEEAAGLDRRHRACTSATSASFGEQLLLSIRYGAWSDAHDADQATNWARFWRPEIQGYIHAYRAVTGVDLYRPSP